MAQYSTNQDRARQSVELADYIIILRVRKAEQQTEIQSKVSDLATGPCDQLNTHSHTVSGRDPEVESVDQNSHYSAYILRFVV